MPWKIKEDQSLNILDLAYTGSVTAHELKESTSECISRGNAKHINRVLVDTSNMKLHATLLDVHSLPSKQYLEEGLHRSARIAVLSPPASEACEAAMFYEDTCVNRGWSVRVFTTRDDALNWLT